MGSAQHLFSLFKPARNGRRGLWVVVLGPDGAGKSSVIAGLGSGGAAGFAGCDTYHLRPAFLQRKRPLTPNCDPHGRAARGALISVFKLAYLLAANWLGYLGVVRPRLSRGTLVLFDRYFPDCLVDPVRYRLPRSCRRLTELIAAMIPQPDLCVVLDAPADSLWERKHEVSRAEMERQRSTYAVLGSHLPNVTVVDAARALPEVVNDVVERIIERHLAYRARYELA